MINSPLGHDRVNAFASVDELSPLRRDSAASEVPFLRSEVKVRKPDSSRARSREVYIVATGRK
jgi:hypothetical protein